jgi:hypothetical protein
MIKYLVTLSTVSMLAFLLLLPASSLKPIDIELLFRAQVSKSNLFIYGNSVLKTSSKCDDTVDTVANFIEQDTSIKPFDLSRGGMRLGNMLASAQTLASLSPKGSTFLFPISLEIGSLNVARDTHHISAFLKKNNKLFDTNPVIDLNSVKTYEGIYYGNYANFSQKFFNQEKGNADCPDRTGHDLNFVKYMYYRNFVQQETSDLLQFHEIREQLKSIGAKGQRVILILMPINYDDIRTLHGDFSARLVERRVKHIKEQLEEFTPLDLSGSVPGAGFTDRWCACGHLNQYGRRIVSKNITKALQPKNL